MALNSANVLVATTGAVYFMPTGTTAPTTALTALPGAARNAGYISEDGVTEAYEEDTTEIKAWQNGTVVRTITSSSASTLHFKIIETNKNSLELFHKGDTVVTDGGTGFKIDVTAPVSERRSFILDVLDGSKHVRLYVPSGEVTERGEVNYVNTDAVGYEVTITCYPVNGVVMTKFSDDAAWNAS